MVQQIIVGIIGVAILVYIVISVRRLITGRRSPCSGCSEYGDCAMKKDLCDEKRNLKTGTLSGDNKNKNKSEQR